MPKILVIEDEKSIREDILEILENNGFDSVGAEDGLIGMRLAINYQPDLIICNVTMPKLDGYGVLRELRSDSQFAKTPFIFMTARAERDGQKLGMNFGADDCIIKPIRQVDLLEAIAARLHKNSDKLNLNTYKQTNQDLIISLQTAEEKLNYLSQNDSLTGLLNRFAFNQKFTQAIADRDSLGVLIVDLDRFNRINKTKGYIFADVLLKLVAERLQRSIDIDCSLARINADEFALILEVNQSTSKALAQSILDSLSQSFVVNKQEVRINASIGIAFYPQHGASLDTLMQSVNTAL